MSIKTLAETLSQNLSFKIESAAPAASYVTNGFVFTWGALTFNQVMMLIGTIFAIATYFTSLYFQRRRDKREQELHQYKILMQHSFRPEDADG